MRLSHFLMKLAVRLPFKRHALHGKQCIRPLFIVGAGRSGTTLLRAMLAAHGEYVIPPESYVLGWAIREYAALNFLPWEVLVRLALSKFASHAQFPTWGIDPWSVYRQAVQFGDTDRNLARCLNLLYEQYAAQKQPLATRWGDKTPMNTLYLDEILAVFPEAQFVHMIRDGRAVSASCVQAGRYDDIGVAARYWLDSLSKARKFAGRLGDSQYLEVRYEELVTEPVATLMTVCEFLDLTYRPMMLEFWKVADQLGDTHFPQHANLHSYLDPRNIDKWKTQLSFEEQRILSKMLDKELGRLGYATCTD